jgi:Tfp pilus assembly PilM family ATPase
MGSDWLRMAQVKIGKAGAMLVAAAEMRVPAEAKKDHRTRMDFMADGARQLLSSGFEGRRLVLGLSPAVMYAQHLRLPKMDEQELRKAVPWEVRGKLPIEPQAAMLRYVIAGEVYREREPGQEIVVLASNKEMVSYYLRVAEKAKLEVLGVEPDPLTISACLRPLYAKSDADPVILYIDLGSGSTRAVISQGSQVRFVRFIGIGAEKLHARQAVPAPLQSEAGQSGGTALAAEPQASLATLVEELELCRRYYDATFPSQPIDRLVFVGGGAMQRNWCQSIAREMNIAAQVGDPLQRLVRSGVEKVGCLDLRQAAPAWTVAIGLSLKSQES